jgi:hypothetical protein
MGFASIPVTTVPRTVADLRASVPPNLVRRATRQGELAGYRIRGVEAEGTRSDLEDDFLVFCRRHGFAARRFTGRQLDEEPERVAAGLRVALYRAEGELRAQRR